MKLNTNKSIFGGAVIGFMTILVLMGSFYTIETGYVGVVSTMGKYNTDEAQPGLHFKVPVVQKIIKFDVKMQTANYDKRSHEGQKGVIDKPSITVLDDKNLPIDLDVSVQFMPKPDQADIILSKYGKNYFEKKMNPIIRNGIRDVVGQFKAETISVNRNELGEKVKDRVKKDFEGSEFIINDVVIRDIRLPKVILQKVEEVQKAKQEEQRLAMVEKQAEKQQKIKTIEAQTHLIQVTTKAKAEAEQKRIAADAEAYAVLTKAEAQAKANNKLSKSLTSELIKYREIDRWDGVMPKTLLQGDKSPSTLLLSK